MPLKGRSKAFGGIGRSGAGVAVLLLGPVALVAPATACFFSLEDLRQGGQGGQGGGVNLSCSSAPPACGEQPPVEENLSNPSCKDRKRCGEPCCARDCCERPLIPAGTFSMGCEGCGPAAPARSVSVQGFRLDTYEVTVGRFREFVAAYDAFLGELTVGTVKGKHPQFPATGWNPKWKTLQSGSGELLLSGSAAELVQNLGAKGPACTWTPQAGSNEAKPINCVSWYEAYAFCAWDGGRLPLEFEWEYAAKGGGQGRLFPWGASFEEGLATSGCGSDCDLPPAGRLLRGKGLWGQTDLAGSVGEWVFDVYDESFYASHKGAGTLDCSACPDPLDCDCVNAKEDGLRRVYRGGTFANTTPEELSTTKRQSSLLGERRSFIGFRCAYSP